MKESEPNLANLILKIKIRVSLDKQNKHNYFIKIRKRPSMLTFHCCRVEGHNPHHQLGTASGRRSRSALRNVISGKVLHPRESGASVNIILTQKWGFCFVIITHANGGACL